MDLGDFELRLLEIQNKINRYYDINFESDLHAYALMWELLLDLPVSNKSVLMNSRRKYKKQKSIKSRRKKKRLVRTERILNTF